MYLFLVDYNFISSEQLQKMIGQILPGADIVNCFSTDTLLKVTEKLLPDIIIIDYDLVGEDQAGLIESLREKSRGAHILALIDPDYYEKLYSAIEIGAVDDYLVKPIRKEDFMARIYIATRRKGLAVEEFPKDVSYVIDKESISPELDYEDDTGVAEEIFDQDLFAEQANSALETKSYSDQKLFSEDDDIFKDEETGFAEKDYSSPYEEVKPEEETPPIEEETLPIEEESPVSEEQPGKYDDIELFEQDDSEPLPQIEELTEDPVLDYNMDYFAPESSERDKPGEETSPEPESTAYDLSGEKHPEEPEEDNFTKLFGHQPADIKSEPDEASFKAFEDLTIDEQEGKKDPGVPLEEPVKPKPEPGPAVVKPAAEFLDEGVDMPQDYSEPVSDPQPADDKYFDDLFSEKPLSTDKSSTEEIQPPDREETDHGEPPGESAESRRERIRQFDLPGESADAFLYGESESEKEDHNGSLREDLKKDDEDDISTQSSQTDEKKPSRRGFGRFLSVFGNIVIVILLLMMATLSFFLIQSRITGGAPQVAGYQMYIVLSDSMSPEFDTGSLAFVREVEPEQIVIGDIITYSTRTETNSLTSHRVVEVVSNDGLRFITRGDANNVNDPNPVLSENVVGRVTGSVPYVGYLLNFVQTREGLILLIFVPGVLIIAYEMSKIVKYLTRGENAKDRSKRKKHSTMAEE